MNKAMLKIIIVSGVLAVVRLADAQQAIFLVRHAEDVRSKDVVDRPLTESGQRRGTLLADVLKDAGIDAIFTSSLQRAVKTAEPLAIASRIEPKPLPQLTTKFDKSDMENFVQLLRSQHRDSIVLFVGHSNTVPALIKALARTDEIKIPETEYDNLFVLFPKSEGARRFYVLGLTNLLIVNILSTLSTITNKKGRHGRLNPSPRHDYQAEIYG